MRTLAIALLLVGCSKRSEPKVQPEAPPTPALVAEADAASADLKEHMREHFATVSDLQRAVAAGRLPQAKADALWLIDHEEPAKLAAWKPYIAELRTAALEVIAAPDLPSAAAITSRLGRACNHCHDATRAVVAFAWEAPPPDGRDLAVQMRRHQWAAARLWEGLVGPSDTMWRGGAAVLATTQLDVASAGDGAPRGDIAALAKAVRELATTAATVDEPDARAKLYGELLSVCAGCHRLVRPEPVRGP